MKKIIRLVVAGLILGLLLSACESLPFELPWLAPATPTSTTQTGAEDLTPTPEVTPTPDVTPEPVQSLVLWVPPEMDPALESEATQIFANRCERAAEEVGFVDADDRAAVVASEDRLRVRDTPGGHCPPIMRGKPVGYVAIVDRVFERRDTQAGGARGFESLNQRGRLAGEHAAADDLDPAGERDGGVARLGWRMGQSQLL